MERYKLHIRFTIIRVIEFFVLEVLCSVALNMAFVFNLFPHTMSYCFMFSAATVAVIVAVDVMMLRRLYVAAERDITYYVISYTAYAVFILFTVFMFLKASDDMFTYILAPVKFMRYTGWKGRYSLVLFHILIIIAIAVAPTGLQSLEKKIEKAMEEKRWRDENALTKETFVSDSDFELIDTAYYEAMQQEERKEQEGVKNRETYEQEGDVDVIEISTRSPEKNKKIHDEKAKTRETYEQAGDVDVIEISTRSREKNKKIHDEKAKSRETYEQAGDVDVIAIGAQSIERHKGNRHKEFKTRETYEQAGDVDVIEISTRSRQKNKRIYDEKAKTRETYEQTGDVEHINYDYYASKTNDRKEKEGFMTHDNYVQETHEEWSGTEDYIRHRHRKNSKND